MIKKKKKDVLHTAGEMGTERTIHRARRVGQEAGETGSRRKDRSSEHYTTGHFGHFYERDAQERVFY